MNNTQVLKLSLFNDTSLYKDHSVCYNNYFDTESAKNLITSI